MRKNSIFSSCEIFALVTMTRRVVVRLQCSGGLIMYTANRLDPKAELSEAGHACHSLDILSQAAFVLY